mgnify:CR=1 FL=1
MQNKVNYEMLSTYSNQLKKIANDMQYITDQTSEIIKSVGLNSFWVGKSADYFQKQFQSIRPYLNEAYDQIINYANMIESIVIKYQQIDQNLSDIVR